MQIGKQSYSSPRFCVCREIPNQTPIAGSFSELLGSLDDAMSAYEYALRANPQSVPAMNAISLILRTREEFHKAVEYLQAILKIDDRNGEVWGSLGKGITSSSNCSSWADTFYLGHCYLMMDDLQQAYAAYQSALVNLPNPKVSKYSRLSGCFILSCPTNNRLGA
jgi:glucose repression mediator protein